MAEIVERRRRRIAEEGAAQGLELPGERPGPVVPFGRDPFIICEVKRRSPSRGEIAAAMDAPAQVARYREQGAPTVSILTEQDHFGGSLADLAAVKRANPELCILRKDFLLTVDDVEVSYRAGADAILLIAGILDRPTMAAMYRRATELGLACLVEVHTPEEVEKVAPIKPAFTGINARDLRSFTVDLTLPLRLKRMIDWETSVVFESGIHSREHAAYAASSGFSGILVGESVVRRPELVAELIAGLKDGSDRDPKVPRRDFWLRLYARLPNRRPLVKICGLTNREDVELADSLGADLLGFILAPSKRRIDPHGLRQIGPTRAPKVGVVVLEGPDPVLDPEVEALLRDGVIDAIQFHGDEEPEACYQLAFPYYKALQLKRPEDALRIDDYRCPRVLVDAHAERLRGGTGKQLDETLIAAAAERRPLWLAGGVGPDNVYHLLRRFTPELIDASSRLEAAPGEKDPQLLRDYFAEVQRAAHDATSADGEDGAMDRTAG